MRPTGHIKEARWRENLAQAHSTLRFGLVLLAAGGALAGVARFGDLGLLGSPGVGVGGLAAFAGMLRAIFDLNAVRYYRRRLREAGLLDDAEEETLVPYPTADIFDKLNEQYAGRAEGKRLTAAASVIHLAAWLSRRRRTAEVADSLRSFFREHNNDSAFLAFVEQQIRNRTRPSARRVVEVLLCRSDAPQRELVLTAAAFVRLSSSRMDESEMLDFFSLARWLDLNTRQAQTLVGLAEDQHRRLGGTYIPWQESDDPDRTARRLLGLHPGCDTEQVKRQYRRLAREYHPDRFSSLGPELALLADTRMAEINAAYDHLRGGSDAPSSRSQRSSSPRRAAALLT